MDKFINQQYRSTKPICTNNNCKKCILFSLYYIGKIKSKEKKIDYCRNNMTCFLPNPELFSNVLDDKEKFFLQNIENNDWFFLCNDGFWRNRDEIYEQQEQEELIKQGIAEEKLEQLIINEFIYKKKEKTVTKKFCNIN